MGRSNLGPAGLIVALALVGCADRVSEIGAELEEASDPSPEPTPEPEPEPDPLPPLCDPGDPSGPDPLDESQGCSAYESQEAAGSVELVVVNEGDEDLILYDPTGCAGGYFILDGVSAGREVHWPLRDCPPNSWHCDRLLEDDPNACSAVCYFQPPVRLEPGGRFSIPWDGVSAVRAAIDPECVPTPYEGAETCEVYMPVPPGAHEIEVRWIPADDCAPSWACTCEPDETGACVLDGLLIPDTGSATVAPFDGLCAQVLIPIG